MFCVCVLTLLFRKLVGIASGGVVLVLDGLDRDPEYQSTYGILVNLLHSVVCKFVLNDIDCSDIPSVH